MQDGKSARELASCCSLGPGSEKCGALLEYLMGGDGIVLGNWLRKLGREGQELALTQLCERGQADSHQF